jgi:hypothetical protein
MLKASMQKVRSMIALKPGLQGMIESAGRGGQIQQVIAGRE